jgi:hypothetical protein
MAYSQQAKETVKRAPKTLGVQVMRWAIAKEFSVVKVSKATGATRQTIYNWMRGASVSPAYRARIKSLLEILMASPTAAQAWRTACIRFDIENEKEQ